MKSGEGIARHSAWLLILFGVVSIATSAGWGVIETSEARYAEISREMLASQDWMHPALMGVYHYHKPPLTYWITSFGYALFGVNPFGARVFLQISVLIQLVVLYRIVRLIIRDQQVAFLACVIYASMTLVLASMRGLTTDCYLTTFVLISIYAWLRWSFEGNPLWLYVTAIAFALGFLTKGPLIFIVPVSFFPGFIGMSPRRAFSIHHVLAFFVFVLAGLWWYVLLITENGDLLSYFLHRQTYERLVHADVFSRSQPFWYYIVYLPLLLLPWSGIFLVSLFFRKTDPVVNRINIFWVGLPLLFFSLASSKLVLYVLPLCGGVAISVASSIDSSARRYHELWVFAFFILEWMALLLVKWIDSSLSAGTLLLAIPAISIGLLATSRSFIPSTRSADRISLYAITSTVGLLIYAAVFLSDNELRVNSTAPVSAWIARNSLGDRRIVIYDAMVPSLQFQSGKDLLTVNAGNKYLQRETGFQRDNQWKKQLLDIRLANESDSVRKALELPSIIISKGNFKKTDEWMKDYFANRHAEGEWTIYY